MPVDGVQQARAVYEAHTPVRVAGEPKCARCAARWPCVPARDALLVLVPQPGFRI